VHGNQTSGSIKVQKCFHQLSVLASQKVLQSMQLTVVMMETAQLRHTMLTVIRVF
jgi:hypothetical protein